MAIKSRKEYRDDATIVFMKQPHRGFTLVPFLFTILAPLLFLVSAVRSEFNTSVLPSQALPGTTTSNPPEDISSAFSASSSPVEADAFSSQNQVLDASSSVILDPGILKLFKASPYSEPPPSSVRLVSKYLFDESKPTSGTPVPVRYDYVLTSKEPLDKAIFYVDCDPQTVEFDFAGHSECRTPFEISLPNFTSNVFHAGYSFSDSKSHIISVIAAAFSKGKLVGVSNVSGNGFSMVAPQTQCDQCDQKKQPDIMILSPQTNDLWKYGESEKISWNNPPELIGRTVKKSIYLGTFFDFQPKRLKLFEDTAQVSGPNDSFQFTMPPSGTAGLPPAEDYFVSIDIFDPFTGITHQGSSSSIQVAEAALKTDNWKTYQNDDFGFSFQYPPEYSVSVDSVTPSNQSLSLTISKGNTYMNLALVPLPNNDWDENGQFVCDTNPANSGCDLYKIERIRTIYDDIPQKIVSLGGSGGDTERAWTLNNQTMYDFSEFKTFEGDDASTTVLDIAKTLQFFQ